ncbi:hypothetical protein K461DRAFT_296517 [Myriangium duriaei CBS 260.36]|uniref:Uncharacterized protein n=1 Tax=Myriangium duriaei CBS 260.36 TaxID=1168546 RepID=A0A9P4J0E6_9PEZI|nr:hypothetical protein K461DRAFT_296517 [Myriangium duriaei CBS 260.36]
MLNFLGCLRTLSSSSYKELSDENTFNIPNGEGFSRSGLWSEVTQRLQVEQKVQVIAQTFFMPFPVVDLFLKELDRLDGRCFRICGGSIRTRWDEVHSLGNTTSVRLHFHELDEITVLVFPIAPRSTVVPIEFMAKLAHLLLDDRAERIILPPPFDDSFLIYTVTAPYTPFQPRKYHEDSCRELKPSTQTPWTVTTSDKDSTISTAPDFCESRLSITVFRDAFHYQKIAGQTLEVYCLKPEALATMNWVLENCSTTDTAIVWPDNLSLLLRTLSAALKGKSIKHLTIRSLKSITLDLGSIPNSKLQQPLTVLQGLETLRLEDTIVCDTCMMQLIGHLSDLQVTYGNTAAGKVGLKTCERHRETPWF